MLFSGFDQNFVPYSKVQYIGFMWRRVSIWQIKANLPVWGGFSDGVVK